MALASFLHWNYTVGVLKLLLPLGLSFHTLQSLAYVIEVYRGAYRAEHNLGVYALYIMFYPKLVAGPIERPQHLLPQFYEKHEFEYDRVVRGLRRMLWGMFKKVVIADSLAPLVSAVYAQPQWYTGPYLIEATIFFALQIYCDFSGYVDIALGSAQVMGFELMENFKMPYLATSISDFWRRWHISLSSWFRDYVYIPLGGNRVSTSRLYFNIFVVFLLSGFWHGANWTFALWGMLHGIYVILSKATFGLRERVAQSVGLNFFPKFRNHLQVAITFSLVSFAWIFFRANNTSDALYIASHLFTGGWQSVWRFIISSQLVNAAVSSLYGTNLIILLAAIFIAAHLVRGARKYGGLFNLFFNGPWLVPRWATYMAFTWAILLLGVFAGRHEFIYSAF